MKIKYVNTFIFSDRVDIVLLIEKQRPAHQRGRLNGIGGKIEAGEAPESAAAREIREECGLAVPPEKLIQFLLMETAHSIIFFFAAFIEHEQVILATTTTDERVMITPCSHVQTVPLTAIMPNLRWQIPMALISREHGSDGLRHRYSAVDEAFSDALTSKAKHEEVAHAY